MSEEALDAMWRALLKDYRRSAASEHRAERVRAAVDAAARAGSWPEVLRPRFGGAPDDHVNRKGVRRPS
jgi:DNA invertase Pin-like site-specific DNA recombinase